MGVLRGLGGRVRDEEGKRWREEMLREGRRYDLMWDRIAVKAQVSTVHSTA